VFKVTVNLTSEKWDESLAAGKSNRKGDLLILKIQFGVSKTIMLGCLSLKMFHVIFSSLQSGMLSVFNTKAHV